MICSVVEPAENTFLRLRPSDVNKGKIKAKVFCKECIERFGGSKACQDMVRSVFVLREKSLFDFPMSK